MLVSSFRMCVVVVALSVLLNLGMVLPTQVAETTFVFLLVVCVRP